MKRQSPHQERRVIRASNATAIAAIILCACSSSVLAQWTQPNAGGHINSTNTGNVGVGTTTPGAKLTVSNNTQPAPSGQPGTAMQIVGANGSTVRLLVDAFGAAMPSIDMRRANSTALSPSGLFNGDGIGQITWQGYGATSYNAASRAKIYVGAAENYTDTAQGAFMTFSVAPRGGITAAEAMRIDATGFVGLGTTAPAFRLDVQGGSINSSGGLCIAGDCKTAWSQVGGSQWSNNGTNIFYNSGHVGIGTNAPVFDSNVAKYLTLNAGVNAIGSIGAGGGTSSAGTAVGQLAFINTNLGTTEKRLAVIVGATDATTNSGMLDFYTASGGIFAAPRMRINSAGNVGIGVMTPGYRLDVQGGSVNASGGLCINGDCKTSWSSVGGGPWATGGSGTINYAGGNVGIGTTTPTQKLEVNGSALISTIYGSSATSGVLSLQSTSHATKGTIQIGFDQTTTTSIGQSGTAGNKLLVATDRLIVNNAGVRVNGAADHGDLSVTKLNITNTDALQFRSNTPNIQSNGSLSFTANNLGGDNVKFNVQNNSISNAFVIDTNSATPARLFDVRDLGTSKFTVAGNGNVGIGTTAPTAKLHVAGDITATGTIGAKYQDVAEWVESSQELSAGTVVVLDHTKSNQVIASTQAYDSRVAGVISLQPGLMLGEAGEGRVLVATTGRVKIKVDATNGPIQIGDLLVTSDKAGFAMKSAPVDVGGVRIHRPGTLIGKALEPLAQGTGEILVLLSLQ